MSKMNRIIQITRRANREEGLSLIELMVAIGILFIALLALARTATVAFTDVAVARQRQTGSQLANRLLEEVRGLPYETVLNGLDDADLAGDPNIVNCGGTNWYYLACPPAPDVEEIVHNPGLADEGTSVPLVPHQGEVGPPDFPSTFEWAVYVTEAADAQTEAGALRVTVRVTWTANQRGGLRNFAEARTLVYSPEGCVDSATHPFSAPCQPYFYGNGSLGSGGVRTTGTLDGVSFDAVDVDLATQSSDAQMEQITHVEGSLNLPRAAFIVDGVETATDSTSVSSAADDDPSTGASEYSSGSVGPQAPGSLSLSGGSRELSVSIGGGMAGGSSSTTAANTTNTCNSQLDDLPCGYGSSLQAGAISETVDLGTDTGTSALVSVGAAGTQGTTYVRRLQPGGSLGLVQETVQWVLPEIQLGGLPSGMETSPPGWEGYWVALTGFSATATAEAGEGTVAPSVTITGGTIRYWNGSGYTDQAVTAGGGAVPIAPVDFTQTSGGPNIQVQITGTVTVQQTGITEELDGTDRIQSKASVGTPLIAEMVYRVFENDSNVTRLLVQFDAGGARAATIYQAAPTGG
jgi:type II secretory pathway pseudopilin PulG